MANELINIKIENYWKAECNSVFLNDSSVELLLWKIYICSKQYICSKRWFTHLLFYQTFHVIQNMFIIWICGPPYIRRFWLVWMIWRCSHKLSNRPNLALSLSYRRFCSARFLIIDIIFGLLWQLESICGEFTMIQSCRINHKSNAK